MAKKLVEWMAVWEELHCGIVGSLAGQSLLVPIMVGYGSQYQIAPILLSGGTAAVVVGTGYAGGLLAKYIYEEENKK